MEDYKVTNIINIDSEFENVHRIECSDGLVIDIPENDIRYKYFEYKIIPTEMRETVPKEYTVLNGIIYRTDNTGTFVSFGGLLCYIPRKVFYSEGINNVSLVYCFSSSSGNQ